MIIKHPMKTCIFLAYNIDFDFYVCLKGNRWPCKTDVTVCGDYIAGGSLDDRD